MPTSALFLALAAAGLHAFWNLVIARASDVEAATAVVLSLSLVLYAPVAALTWDVEPEVWPYVVVSSAVELAYVILLAAAYRRADLSVVYPVGRGLAPVLVLWKKAGAATAHSPGALATGGAGVLVGVSVAGLALIAFLLATGGGDAESGAANISLGDAYRAASPLRPGMH